MLILTRQVGEVVKLGEDITVAVLGIRSNQVRIDIDTPQSAPIQREEIHSPVIIDQKSLETGDVLSDFQDVYRVVLWS